jgi:hypothetical protein
MFHLIRAFNAKLELVGEITQYDIRIYQGVPGRGGAPYGVQASFTLMRAAGEPEAAKEPETMEPDAEIPTEEPTEPEPVITAETVSEAPPKEETITEPEAPPSDEAAVIAEAAPEPIPEPVVEEEPPAEEKVVEAPPPEPPAPKEAGIIITFNPESPLLIDGTEPIIVNGYVKGMNVPTTEKFYVNVVRIGENGTTIPVTDTKLYPEGDRTATSHSLAENLQVF